MLIGELSAATGISPAMIRVYEKKGLLEPPVRMENNYRTYGGRHLKKLQFIAHCRKLDMSLEEIREILGCDWEDPEEAGRIHELLHRQIDEVSRRIEELTSLKARLVGLERSCHGHRPGEVCGIVRSLSEPGPGEPGEA